MDVSRSTRGTATKRVGVLVVAYNAATTLVPTLNRLPESFRATVDHILVCDDASSDGTYNVGLRYKSDSALPLTIVRNEKNRGYGGNQKAGYHWAIEHGLDIVVLLHGDGQYAPEIIEDVVAPLVSGAADAVFGSRMMIPGRARAGGMPYYKYAGNKILTTFQNAVAGLELTEWHSGYRAYRVDALEDLDFESYSEGFNFDTQIILGLAAAGKTIAEIPIPTYYGDEICYVNGMKYAKDVVLDVIKFRARRIFGVSAGTTGTDTVAYRLKPSGHSSHGKLLSWLRAYPPSRVLDAGCSDGDFGDRVRAQGHYVVGIDLIKHEGVGERLDEFVEADLNHDIPPEVGAPFDVVVAGDVLEHVIDPAHLLTEFGKHLVAGGSVLVSVPNFAHWYPRTRVAIGRFDYDERGPLDHGHVRFFTRRSFERLVGSSEFRIVERLTVGSPVELLDRQNPEGFLHRFAMTVGIVDRLLARAWPTMFGYQFLYKLERA